VREEDALKSLPLGPDPEVHLASIEAYMAAGVDEVYVQQIGPDREAFFRGWAEHVLPEFR